MILSWIFGLLLIHSIGFQQLGQEWMVLLNSVRYLLTVYHFYLGNILKSLKLIKIIDHTNFIDL